MLSDISFASPVLETPVLFEKASTLPDRTLSRGSPNLKKNRWRFPVDVSTTGRQHGLNTNRSTPPVLPNRVGQFQVQPELLRVLEVPDPQVPEVDRVAERGLELLVARHGAALGRPALDPLLQRRARHLDRPIDNLRVRERVAPVVRPRPVRQNGEEVAVADHLHQVADGVLCEAAPDGLLGQLGLDVGGVFDDDLALSAGVSLQVEGNRHAQGRCRYLFPRSFYYHGVTGLLLVKGEDLVLHDVDRDEHRVRCHLHVQ